MLGAAILSCAYIIRLITLFFKLVYKKIRLQTFLSYHIYFYQFWVMSKGNHIIKFKSQLSLSWENNTRICVWGVLFYFFIFFILVMSIYGDNVQIDLKKIYFLLFSIKKMIPLQIMNSLHINYQTVYLFYFKD